MFRAAAFRCGFFPGAANRLRRLAIFAPLFQMMPSSNPALAFRLIVALFALLTVSAASVQSDRSNSRISLPLDCRT